MIKKFRLTIALMLFFMPGLHVVAEDDTGIVYLQRFTGPFKGSEVTKFFDKRENVLCYIYAPKQVVSTPTQQGIRFEANNVGAISCVKVR